MSSGKLTLGRPATTTSFGSAPADMKMLADMVDMGFDNRIAERALSAVNNKSIDLAINYINEHPEDDLIIEQPAPVTTQPQYVKPFVDSAPLAPSNMPTLMDEHRKLVKDGLRGDDPEVKEAFRRKVIAEEAAKREKERKEKNQALKELRKKMRQEKEERIEKQNKKLMESTSNVIVKSYPLSAPSTSSPPIEKKDQTPPPKNVAKECIVQVRLPEGQQVKLTLLPTDTLSELVKRITSDRSDDNEEFSLLIPFPRKEYTSEEFETTTLLQAGLAPRGSLTLQKLKSKGVVTKGAGVMDTTTDHQMDPDDSDDEDYRPPHIMPGGGRVLQPSVQLTEPDEIPISGPVKTKYEALLCSQQWLSSKEEEQSEQGISIYRPSTFNFPKQTYQSSNNRSGISFFKTGNFSESR
ncbi:UBX domain-containing protein, partial [Acrasis kona]